MTRVFAQIVNAVPLSLCDTVGLLAVARRRGAPLARARYGRRTDRTSLRRRGRGEGCRSISWAARPASRPMRRAILEVRYPGLQIAGTHDGFFTEEQTPAIVQSDRRRRGASALRRHGISAARVLARRTSPRNRLRRGRRRRRFVRRDRRDASRGRRASRAGSASNGSIGLLRSRGGGGGSSRCRVCWLVRSRFVLAGAPS